MQHKSHSKNAIKSVNNRGNALVIILVMIALIAALTAVAMRSTNRSATNMDTETARIQAEKLMRQAVGYESAVNRLRTVNQCAENDLNFDNNKTTRDYENPKAPTSKNCNLFDVEGAGLSYSEPAPVALDPTFSSQADYGEWIFTGGYCVLQLGSDDDDNCVDEEVALMAIVPFVSAAVCMQINDMNGIDNPSGAPPEESMSESAPTFVGTFTAASDPEIGEGSTGVNLAKHATGCFESDSGAWSGANVFYHVLFAR